MTSLSLIRGLARAGATQRAWALFEAEGYATRADDVDALTLKGRLLKDKARLATSEERCCLLEEAERAYAGAAALSPATYPLINAATIALLGGRWEQACSLAKDTLTLLESGHVHGETPYWLAATRAEALLIIGKMVEARVALADAMAQAPQAWEDHASTLRQFELIMNEQGEDTSWLDRHRPPISLHFSGMMGIAPDDAAAVAEIGQAIREVKPGFGFGALAAGSDILMAEELVRQGASLHVVLPGPPDIFRQQSVMQVDEAWGPRFDALVDAAETLEALPEHQALSPAAIALADEMAMGLALRQAQTMESHAIAFRVNDRLDPESEPPAADQLWRQGGRKILSLALSRAIASPSLPEAPAISKVVLLAADTDVMPQAEADWTVERSGHLIMAFHNPALAASTAQAIANSHAGGARVGLDHVALDPDNPDGDAFDRLLLVAARAQQGVPSATAPLALALALHAPQFHCEPAGEIKANIGDIPYWNIWAASPEQGI